MVTLDTILKYFLPTYLIVYFATTLFWRSYITWKTTGVMPYVFGKTDNTHDFVGLCFRLTLFACAIVVGIYSFWSGGYQYLEPILWLNHSVLIYFGLGLLVASLTWTFIAQLKMGSSWRIGIDLNHKTELVQTGIFSLSRNPIFLGMRLTLLGLFFILPNAITFAIVVVGDMLIQIQVRLEEEFLAKTYGETYQNYCRKTRRWV